MSGTKFPNGITANVIGDVTGNLTGNVTGNVTGAVTGNVTGDLTGAVTGNVTGNLTGDVTGAVTGNVTGNLTGDVTGAVTGNVTGDLTGNVTGNAAGYALKTEARTATTTGATSGTISAGTTHVVVTCDNADKIIILPAPVLGLKITLINGATGYEIRSSAPATIGINGGTGENAESAVAGDTIVKVECVSATNWIGATVTAAGVIGVLEVAA